MNQHTTLTTTITYLEEINLQLQAYKTCSMSKEFPQNRSADTTCMKDCQHLSPSDENGPQRNKAMGMPPYILHPIEQS
jgi:hypothetical protein